MAVIIIGFGQKQNLSKQYNPVSFSEKETGNDHSHHPHTGNMILVAFQVPLQFHGAMG